MITIWVSFSFRPPWPYLASPAPSLKGSSVFFQSPPLPPFRLLQFLSSFFPLFLSAFDYSRLPLIAPLMFTSPWSSHVPPVFPPSLASWSCTFQRTVFAVFPGDAYYTPSLEDSSVFPNFSLLCVACGFFSVHFIYFCFFGCSLFCASIYFDSPSWITLPLLIFLRPVL